eukprot:scaffold85848_cov30-Tisochrysis_lutea.AAC.1
MAIMIKIETIQILFRDLHETKILAETRDRRLPAVPAIGRSRASLSSRRAAMGSFHRQTPSSLSA